MLTYSSKDARQNWRKILDIILARGQDILIERNGKPAAVIVPVEDYENIREALEEYREGLEAQTLYDAWKAGREESVSIAEARQELGLDE
jgi:prevent-host-death family protein